MANFLTLWDDFLPLCAKPITPKDAKEKLQEAILLEKLRWLPYLYQRRKDFPVSRES